MSKEAIKKLNKGIIPEELNYNIDPSNLEQEVIDSIVYMAFYKDYTASQNKFNESNIINDILGNLLNTNNIDDRKRENISNTPDQ
jgi:hypothetical protein